MGEERPHQWTHRIHIGMPIQNYPQLVLLIEHRLVDRLITRIRLPQPVQKLHLPLPQVQTTQAADYMALLEVSQ